MFPTTIKTCLQALLIVTTISVSCGQDRKISPKLNPGCGECTSEDILVYIKAVGSHDTLHVFWDFQNRIFGSPMVYHIVTDSNATLQINWEGTVPSINTTDLKYVFLTGIPELYEYNDLKDIGHFDSRMPYHKHELQDLSWTLKESVLNENGASIRAHGLYKERRTSGIVDVKLDFLPFTDYAKELPHLIHTANSTLIDMGLVNWTMRSDYNSSRFAMRFLMVSSDDSNGTMHRTIRKSLDDEHTPGVFEIIEIITPESYKSDDGGFIQFRPVGYTDSKRDVSSSTNIFVSDFKDIEMASEGFSAIKSMYHGFKNSVLGQEVFISIGIPGDGFYKQHNFTSWSYTVGYGRPPVEGFSLFVVIIISIGLGVPVLLALSGVVYVIVRRYKQRNPPTRFTDED